MQHEKRQKVKIDTTTGEVYLSYSRTDEPEMGRLRRMVHWFNQKIDNHFDRLIELRVYDDRRYDYRVKKVDDNVH